MSYEALYDPRPFSNSSLLALATPDSPWLFRACSLYSCSVLFIEHPPLPFSLLLWKPILLMEPVRHDSASKRTSLPRECLVPTVSFYAEHLCSPCHVEFKFCLPVCLPTSEPFVSFIFAYTGKSIVGCHTGFL